VFGCNLVAAFFSSKRDFPDLFRNFMASQRVIVVFRELPASVAALDRLGLSLEMTFNDGMVVAQ
jgi:hypothetical protein